MLPILWVTLAACVPVLTSPGGADDGPWEAPENTWPLAAPPADLEGQGFETGQVLPDFRGMDQNGDEVSLWQFYGLVWVLDISTMWCSPCQALAQDVQATADEYADEGFVYVTVFPEDVDGDSEDPVVPDVEDLQDWSEYFGIDQPLLSDAEGYSYGVVTDNTFPALFVIDRDLKIGARVSTTTDAAVRAAVEQIL